MNSEVQIRHSFKNAVKEAGKYVGTSYFLIYSIITSVVMATGGIDYVLSTFTSPVYFFVIPIGFTAVGILSASADLKKLKRTLPNLSKTSFQIMVATFLFISAMNDVVYFEIDGWSVLAEKYGTPEQQNALQLRFDQAQMADFVNFFMYPVFFHGNRIWNWIREREKIVDQIEAQMDLPQIQSKG